jgi:hypothetical protein
VHGPSCRAAIVYVAAFARTVLTKCPMGREQQLAGGCRANPEQSVDRAVAAGASEIDSGSHNEWFHDSAHCGCYLDATKFVMMPLAP